MQVTINHLTFGYDGSPEEVFSDLSLALDTQWRLGLIGRNGRGKTTLLRLLAGELDHRGAVSSPLRMDYFPFTPPREEGGGAMLALDTAMAMVGDPTAAEWQLLREADLLELDPAVLYQPFDTLSGGERTKLQLAALFLRQNNFLLIDEPTNHLDTHGRQVLGDYLGRGGRGFLLVSHDRDFLDRSCDHILALNPTGPELVKGNYSVWQENKDARDAWEQAEHRKLTKEVGRLQQAARQTKGWSDQIEQSKIGTGVADRGYVGHKSAKMMKRSKAIQRRREDALSQTRQLLKNLEEADTLKLHPLAYPKERLAEARQLAPRYGDRIVCGPLDFQLCRGDRLVLEGPNGSGKSTLMKLLMGREVDHGGTLTLGSGLVISHVPQDSAALAGDLGDFARDRGLDVSLFFTILRKLDFTRGLFDRDMGSYSQGQKKKVLLAASLATSAHLYLWDEPLNYVDLLSRIQLENLILEYQPTMVLVEHDARFCRRVGTRHLTL